MKISDLGEMLKPASQLVPVEFIPTSISSLNDVVFACGGMPRGRVIEIFAEESQGKCVYKRTLVCTEEGIKSMSDFDSNDYKDDSFNDLKIKVLDNDHFVETDKVYVKDNVPTIELKTLYGYEEGGTPHHKIKIVDPSGELIWKKLSDSSVNDWVVISSPDLYHNSENPMNKDKKAARLLGYLIAEGGVSNYNQFSFTNSSKPMIDDYVSCLNEILEGHKTAIDQRKRKDHHQPTYRARTSRRSKTESESINRRKYLLDKYNLGYWDSGTKEIPKWVLENSPKIWIEFLNGYLAGDGGVSYTTVENRKHRSIITACSKSEKLIEQLHFMLLMLGIVSRRYIKKHKLPNKEEYRDYYNLKISGRFAVELSKMLDLRHKEKMECLKKSSEIEGTDLSDIIHCPELLKNVKEWVINQSPSKGYRKSEKPHPLRDIKAKKLNYMIRGVHRITRFEIKKLIDSLESSFPNCPYTDQLKYLSSNERFYDQITEISHSIGDVIDFSIPSTHSFIGNGFINHNSTLAQWLVAQAQKQGFNAFWADAEKTFDKNYAKGSGVDTDKLMMLDFSFMEDLLYKLKLLTASNLFDIGVIDSVNSVLPQVLGEAKIEGLNMNERLISARIWAEFFHMYEGGYRIKDLKTGKYVKSNVITKIINEKKLIEESTDEIHKISQKKLVLILINHKQSKIGVQYGQKWYTPGGKRKDFAYSVRLDMSRKKTETGQVKGVKGVIKHRIVQIKAMKNKVGIPLGVATLKMTVEGDFLPIEDEELKDLTLVDEVEKIPEKEAVGAMDLLEFKLAKEDND